MGKFNFDVLPNRIGTGCYKYDEYPGLLPLWVADMDFEVAPCIQEALRSRLKHPVFGYNIITPSWKQSYVDFYKRRYGWEFSSNDIFFVTGVVPALSSSVRALTDTNDEVVVFPPVYNIFYNSIRNSNRVAIEVPLLFDGEHYQLDYENIEKAFASKKAKLCFLCNPGNPTSRIWSKEELAELASLAKKHNVIILSDEIHGPISRPNTKYQPFLSSCPWAKEVGFAAFSVTKAFNLAGIQTAAIVCENPAIRHLVERQINTDEVAEPNSFALIASEAALNEGEPWLEEMNDYVFCNRDFASSYIKEYIPSLHPIEGDATYLLWVDVSLVTKNASLLINHLKEKQLILFNDGASYGKTGESFIRINLATSRDVLKEALRRLKEGVESFKESL